MADDRSVMRKSDILVFIVDAFFAGTIPPVGLVVDYESARYIDLDRSWVGRHARGSTSGVGVGRNLRCSNPITSHLSGRHS
jgi:hypothetical protein